MGQRQTFLGVVLAGNESEFAKRNSGNDERLMMTAICQRSAAAMRAAGVKAAAVHHLLIPPSSLVSRQNSGSEMHVWRNSQFGAIHWLVKFCYVFLCELRGTAWAVGSYSIVPPARGISQKH